MNDEIENDPAVVEFGSLMSNILSQTPSAQSLFVLCCAAGYRLRDVVMFRYEDMRTSEFRSRTRRLATALDLNPNAIREWVDKLMPLSKVYTGKAFKSRWGACMSTRTAERRLRKAVPSTAISFRQLGKMGRALIGGVTRMYTPKYYRRVSLETRRMWLDAAITRLRPFLIKRHGQDLDDVVQDIQFRLLSSSELQIGSEEEAIKLVRWASHIQTTETRKKKVAAGYPMGNGDKLLYEPSSALQAKSTQEDHMLDVLKECVGQMSEDEQVLIEYLMGRGEYPNGRELAEKLRIRPSQVRTHVTRVKKKLQDMMMESIK